MIDFYKYHGAGNDFIMIDNRQQTFVGDKVEFARKWCERRFGIGSDGVIFIELSEGVDYLMDFYNPDGSQSFCGNGSRCAFAFARFLGIVDDVANFMAIDGLHKGKFDGENYHIHMQDVDGIEHIGNDHFIQTGSPHYISWCDSNDSRDIVVYGKSIRYSERFKEAGTNVNLVKRLSDSAIEVRTYERGVEDETFACGTGATACGLSTAYRGQLSEGTIDVKVKGGNLKVKFKRDNELFTDVWLVGPATFVYKGQLDG